MEALRKLRTLCMIALVAVSLIGAEEAAAQGGVRVSFQTFYDELSPYGRWIHNPAYGYVWAPQVEPGFQPYATRGHWVMTEYGNTWVSDYRWGWAAFHYGRWLYDNFYGWVWVPGNEWGPAWVHWRTGGDYYGWAPLGPGLHINISINIPVAHWVFVPRRYITSPRFHRYCVSGTRVTNIYHNTTIINNYYDYGDRTYVYGPRADDIEQHTSRKVRVYQVSNDSRPGRPVVDRNAVRMYRPEVASERPQRNEAPARIVSREAVSRPERSSLNGSRNRIEGDHLSTERRSNTMRDSDAVTRDNTRESNSTGRVGTERENPFSRPDRDLNRGYQPEERTEVQRPSREPASAQSPVRSEGTIRHRSERPERVQRPAVVAPIREQAPDRPVERIHSAPQVRREQVMQEPQPRMQQSQPQMQQQVQPRRPERQSIQQVQPQRQSQPQPQRQVVPQRVGGGRPIRN